MELKKAEDIAQRIILTLRPYCVPDRIFIAGSIRRKVEQVKDIEVVALPDFENKIAIGSQSSLFGDKPVTIPTFFHAVKQLGEIQTKLTEQSRQVKVFLPEGIKLDMYLPQEHDFFRQYAIRTGSAKYVYHNIAKKWTQKKWRGTDDGLRLHKECINIGTEDAPKWKCNVDNPTLPPAFNQSEEHFFIWLGVPWVPPQMRNWQSEAKPYPIRHFTCMTCKDNSAHELSYEAFKEHLKSVHGIDGKINGNRKGQSFINGAGWFAQTWIWTLQNSNVQFREYYEDSKKRK